MTWTCEQIEARLSDYLDGTLSGDERTAFDGHVSGCERCEAVVVRVSQLLTGLHAMAPVEAPPRLVYSILDKTLGPRESVAGWFGWLRGLASLRVAYGAVSVVATFLVLVTASGFNWRHPKLADLQPTALYRNADRQVHLVYARGTKFVSDLRVVNEIQSRVHDENEIPASQESTVPEPAPEKHPGQSDGSQPASPRQQNRANGIGRQFEVLAAEIPALAGEWSCSLMARRVP